MMLAIIFLHAAWRLVVILLKMLVVADHGVGNAVRNSVLSTMTRKRASACQMLKIIMDNVAKQKKAFQRRHIVLVVIIHIVIRDGNCHYLFLYILKKNL
jgi:hypothetical protein